MTSGTYLVGDALVIVKETLEVHDRILGVKRAVQRATASLIVLVLADRHLVPGPRERCFLALVLRVQLGTRKSDIHYVSISCYIIYINAISCSIVVYGPDCIL